MRETAGFITGLFSGLDLRLQRVAGALIVFLALLAFWAYQSYSGAIFYQTLERRLALIERLLQLEDGGIGPQSGLWPAYVSVLENLSRREDFRIPLPLSASVDSTSLGKAISGASLWVLLLVVGVTSQLGRDKKLTGTIVGVALLLALIAYLFGWLATLIPTLGNPWVNYIGFPILQFSLLSLLARTRRK